MSISVVKTSDSLSQLYLQWDALLVLYVHLRSMNGSLLLFNFQISVLCPDVGSNVHWLTATPDPSISIFKPFRFGPQGQGRTSVLTQSSLPFPHQAKVCLGKQVSYWVDKLKDTKGVIRSNLTRSKNEIETILQKFSQDLNSRFSQDRKIWEALWG